MDTGINHSIKWLLGDEAPEVKYRTMIELLDMPKDGTEVKMAYDILLSSKRLNLVMDKFSLNKKWEDVNALLALTEFGLTREDVPIDGYVERVIKKLNMSMKCAKTLLLRNLVSLGYYGHPWVQEQIPLVFSAVRQDGTLRCLDKGKKTNDSRLPDMGCYRQTTTCLLLAAELKKAGVILPQFEPLINFYISHGVLFRPDAPEKVIVKDMAGTFYPIDHVHMGLQMIMYGLSILGAAKHPNCKKAWALLDSKKDAEGKYILTESFAEPYFDVGAAGKPNKWVTLYALLTEKYRTR